MANDSHQKPNAGGDNWGAPVTPPGPGGTDESGGGGGSLLERLGEYVPYWLTWRETMIGAALGAVAVLVLILLISLAFTLFDSSSLSSTVDAVRTQRAADTYSGWKKAYGVADRTLKDRSGPVRQFLHAVGFFVPVSGPAYLRKRVRDHRAFVAAVLEYRFESAGARKADELAWEAFEPDSTEPMAAATRVYLLLTRGEPGEALAVARKARKKHQSHRVLHATHLEAALAAGRASAIEKTAASLRKARTSPNAWEQFLLARAARYGGKASAAELLDTLNKQRPNHLSARIERLEGRLATGAYGNVTSGAGKLLGEFAEKGSPHQLAQLHNLHGTALAGSGSPDKARKAFQKAIDANPSRPDAYLGKVRFLMSEGSLEAALRTLEQATDEGPPTAEVLAARAELAYLQGRFDAALDLLSEPPDSVALAPVVKGLALIESGQFDRAVEHLRSVAKSHPQRTVARALEIAASAATSSEIPESAPSEMKALVSSSDRPAVLRAAARLRIRMARTAEEDERRSSQIKRAEKLLEDAAKRDGSALNYYLLCEAHTVAGDAEKADEACEKARDRNADFVPGMLTVARLRLQQQRPRDAAVLLAGLTARFPDRWEVASLYVRTLLRSQDPGRASDVLEYWKGREGADTEERTLLRGRVRHARGDYDAAAKLLKKARESAALEDEASLFYAHSLVRLGRLEAAEKMVDPLTDVPEWEGVAWAIFGELRRRQEEALDAIENTRIARRNLDMDSDPLWQISYAYAESALAWQEHRDWGDTRVARYLNRGVDRGDPRSPEIGFARGLFYLYSRERNADRAVRLLEGVVEIQSHRCEAIEFLDNAYEDANDYDGMRRVDDLLDEYCG